MPALPQDALLRLLTMGYASKDREPIVDAAIQQKDKELLPSPLSVRPPMFAEAEMNREGIPAAMPQDTIRQLALLKALAPKNLPTNPNFLPHTGGILPPNFKRY